MGSSKHLNIPALRKHWGLSGEKNHGIFMFFASYLTSPLGRQPLFSLPWERTGQAVQDPSSQPGLITPWTAPCQGPSCGISFHICQEKGWKVSPVQLSCFFSLMQCLIESFLWQATGVLPQSSQASRTKQERQWLQQQAFGPVQVFRQTLNPGLSEGIERRERLTRLVSTKISYIPDKYLSAQKG